MMDPALANTAAAVGGGAGGLWLLKWLLTRAVAQIDGTMARVESSAQAGLLRVGEQLDRVEATQQRHAETLAVICHTLGIRFRKE